MPRLCCGFLSRRKRKSFPIHEKQCEAEINKVFIKHVENIRVTPPPIINPPQDKKTISKTIIKKKSIDPEINCKTSLSDKQTIIKNNSTDSRIPVYKLFQTSKQIKIPSPLPVTNNNISEENHDKTASSWSSSTNTNFHEYKRNLEYRTYVENYDSSKNIQKKNISEFKKLSNDIKPPAKSKAVLENVRKMIKDQNIQQQQHHFNHIQQKESVRL